MCFYIRDPSYFQDMDTKSEYHLGYSKRYFYMLQLLTKRGRILTEFLDWALLVSDRKTYLPLRLGTRNSITPPCSIGTRSLRADSFILLICFICTYFIYLLNSFYFILLFSQELFFPSKERMEGKKSASDSILLFTSTKKALFETFFRTL